MWSIVALHPFSQALWGGIWIFTVKRVIWGHIWNLQWRNSTKCNQCKFAFTQVCNLKKHLITQSGQIKKIRILDNFSRILEKFHFSISISRHFHFTFHSRSRSQGIFISLFILDLELKAFVFHFSFSKWVNQIFISLFTSQKKVKENFFTFTSQTFNIHSRWTLLLVLYMIQFKFSVFNPIV